MTTPNVVLFGPDILDRMVRAVQAVRDRLLRATAALEREGVPYAVIGGHAVAAWVSRMDPGGVRNTPDVDLLVRRCDLDAVSAALMKSGFVRQDTAEIVAFLDGPNVKARDAVHLFFVGEKVRPDDLLPAPDLTESQGDERFRVINLEALVRMKLVLFRLKDRVHLRDLIDIGLIDASWVHRFSGELATRLQQIVDAPNG
jgi:hypothetical protein